MNSATDIGAWIVAISKVLSQYNTDDPALDELEAIITAGRAAALFSALRSAGVVQQEKYEIHRKLAGLKPSIARRVVETAARTGYVSVEWTSDTAVERRLCFAPIDTYSSWRFARATKFSSDTI